MVWSQSLDAKSDEPSLPFHEKLMEENTPNFYMTFRATKSPPDYPGLAARDDRLLAHVSCLGE